MSDETPHTGTGPAPHGHPGSEHRTNAELIQAVTTFQRWPYVHPLTCGTKSSHRLLVAREDAESGQVVLYCRDCGYEQELYPHLREMALALADGLAERGDPFEGKIGEMAWRSGDENG